MIRLLPRLRQAAGRRREGVLMDLLSSCTSGGCGAKIGPGELASLLSPLSVHRDEKLLVGYDTGDDAAAYQLSDDVTVVSTVDFFSPMVNDAYLFGKIAAANALSDIYAMGAEPLFALNLVCFPQKEDKAVLGQVLAGGASKLEEARVSLAGGHSIYDHEIKYGLSVTGRAHPGRLLRNNRCRPGDLLILTKPLGVGIVMAANRVELATPEHFGAATASMERLNRYAALAAAEFAPSACTDVTGFGLLAHLLEMVSDTCSAWLDPLALPLLPGAHGYAADYLLTAAGQRNREHVEQRIGKDGVAAVSFPLQELMFDPQTSGGLLLSVPESRAEAALAAIRREDPAAAIIGGILPKGGAETPITFLEGYL